MTYIAIVGDSLYKIGSSNNVKDRAKMLKHRYGSCTFVNMFECFQNEPFERFLHKHEYIEPFNYRELIKGIESTEVFKLDTDQLQKVVEIANTNLAQFNTFTPEQLLQEQQLKLEAEKLKTERIKQETEKLKAFAECKTKVAEYKMERYIEIIEKSCQDCQENQSSQDYPTFFSIKKRENGRSPRVQKYTVNTDGSFELTDSYSDIITAVRENPGSSAAAMRLAAKQCSMYKGVRWWFMDRSEDANQAQPISPTADLTSQKNETVAMMDLKKERIVKLFATKKDAAADRQLKSIGSVCNAINRGTVCSGHMFCYYNDCSDELKDEYLANGGQLPTAYKATGIRIQQIHPVTGLPVAEFSSAADVVLKFQMSRTSLKKAINTQTIHNGWMWCLVP